MCLVSVVTRGYVSVGKSAARVPVFVLALMIFVNARKTSRTTTLSRGPESPSVRDDDRVGDGCSAGQ